MKRANKYNKYQIISGIFNFIILTAILFNTAVSLYSAALLEFQYNWKEFFMDKIFYIIRQIFI